jgi:hypothetical protein
VTLVIVGNYLFIQSGLSRIKGVASPSSRNESNIGGRVASNAAGLSSRDRNIHAPELSGTVSAVGALDINGRAAGNAAGLSSRDGNGRAPELFGTADALDINGEVEGHGCHVRPARPLGHSTHYTPASGGDGETGIVVDAEITPVPPLPSMLVTKAAVGTELGHPLQR